MRDPPCETPHPGMRRSVHDSTGAASRLSDSAPQVPEHLELALGGERRVDAVEVELVGTADGLFALGQRPGAGRVAGHVQLGHVAAVIGLGDAGRLAADIGHGTLQLDRLLVQGLAFGRHELRHSGGIFLALVAFGHVLPGIGVLVTGIAAALAAHGLDDVEGVGFARELGGHDAHRTNRLQAAFVHRALDPLDVVLHRLLDDFVVALDRAGVGRQQVLGRDVDDLEAGQGRPLDAVVEVGYRSQHAGQAVEAELHGVADVAADVQAGVAAQQVPAVVDLEVLGDLDVAAAATGRLQGEGRALVGAALVVLDLVDHAPVLFGLGDLPAALAHARHLGVVVDAGADAGVGAGAVQGDLAQRVGMPVVEALEAVERVEHDRHPAIGLDAFGQGTAGRDRKSTRLNSSHVKISYAVFC